LVEIQRELQQRGLLINERTSGKLYRQFLALLGGMTSQHQQRLETAARQHAGLIWAIDATSLFQSFHAVAAVVLSTAIGMRDRKGTASR
jgi:hypothetical protein